MKGKVYLVGAGPGDPDLLTVRHCACCGQPMQYCTTTWLSPEILKLIPPSAQLHNVGKRCGKKKIQQEEINFLMIAAGGIRPASRPLEVRRPA